MTTSTLTQRSPRWTRSARWLGALTAAASLASADARAESGDAANDRAARGHAAHERSTHDHGSAPGRVLSDTQRAPLAEARAEIHRMREVAPPPPPGVTDLDFAEFFAPIGDRGPTYSAQLKRLAGKPVRLLGYMVHQDAPTPGALLLAPFPFQLHESEYGLAEDLPATVVHVFDETRKDELVPFTPGLLLLTGELSIGPREERDGRISTVRLQLFNPASAHAAATSKEKSR